MIGDVFIQQYYNVLHGTPEMAYKFYKDTSFVSRQDSDGTMTTVTTYPKIKEKVEPLGFSSCILEIHTSCAQQSQMDGLIAFTTGCAISTERWTRGFSQSFFLAPQEGGGFFVMNDVFQFVSGTPQLKRKLSEECCFSGAEPAAAGDEREGNNNPAAENSRSRPSESNGGSGIASRGDDVEGWVKVDAESQGNVPIEGRKASGI